MRRKFSIYIYAFGLLLTAFFTVLATGQDANAQESAPAPPEEAPPRAVTGPVISAFGPVYPIAEPGFPARPDHVYRVVFDVGDTPAAANARNAKIETVARFLNLHARAGVPPENMQLALVLHGAAGRATLQNAPYRERFGVDNPDLALLEALHEAGVEIYLCGQTAAHRGLATEELAPPVELALSAMTVLATLQNEGFALIAF